MKKNKTESFSIFSKKRITAVISAVTLNVLLSRLTQALGLPLYLDTIGTIFTAGQCGLFYGILTALSTNIICGFFKESALYFSIINILTALCTEKIFRHQLQKKTGGNLLFLLLLTGISGIGSTLIEWSLYQHSVTPSVAALTEKAENVLNLSPFFILLLINLLVNLADKAISVLAALSMIHVLPESVREELQDSSDRRNISGNGKDFLNTLDDKERISRRNRLTISIGIVAVVLTGVIAWNSVSLYTSSTREQRLQMAYGVVRMAADTLDADMVETYLAQGDQSAGYAETKQNFSSICNNTPAVKYLYAMKIQEDGCFVVIDTETEDTAAYSVGDRLEIEEAFEPYMPALLAGEEIEPIESNDITGWVLTVYYPVHDSAGKCVCYVGTDISLNDVRDYVNYFMLRLILISSGFLILSMSFAAWLTNNYHKTDDLQILLKKQDQDQTLIREIVEAFARVIDMKDEYTRGHSLRVAKYTSMLTKELGYDEETTERYYNIALLHDIGKVGIPQEVLNKPGKLNDEEYNIIKSHSSKGYNVLKDISVMPELAIGAKSHHERPDGKGYPEGLKGDEIPRVAQIIAVADTFDAMYSNRPYRKRMNFEKAVSIIREISGTQLTSDVVDAFLRLVERGEFRDPDDQGGGTTENIYNIHKKFRIEQEKNSDS